MSRRGSFISNLDWVTIAIYLFLTISGLFVIYASIYDGTEISFTDSSFAHGRQLQWLLLSLGIAVAINIVDFKFYPTFAYPVYAGIMLLLVAVLFFGVEVKGSKSWFSFGGFRMQPAELAKFAAALAVARFLSTNRIDLKTMRDKVIAALIIGLPTILIIIQGDTGSALVFAAFIFVFFREGLESGFLIIGGLLIVLSVLALIINKFILLIGMLVLVVLLSWLMRQNKKMIYLFIVAGCFSAGYIFTVDYTFNEVLQPHQQDRINVLLGKAGNDWNVRQSKIAIGSGGITGKGFLRGTQTKFNFVPEQSTDFIFCTIGEEFGFLGSVILVGSLSLLLFRVIFLAERQRSKFSRIYGYGVASILFFHMIVNVGMTIGLVPVIGIPLPFISYGGSSVLSFTILLFILLKLDAHRLEVLR